MDKTQNSNNWIRTAVIMGILQGLIFSGLMALFDHYDGKEFSIFKFLFNATFFGFLMGCVTAYNDKRRAQKANKEE